MDLLQGVRARQTSNPRTVLGFFAGVLIIDVSGAIGASGVLAQTHTMTGLIPLILGFGALIFLLVVVAVLVAMVSDPSKLMLGQITGSEFLQIRQSMVLGDSERGEHEETEFEAVLPSTVLALPEEPTTALEEEDRT